MFGLSMALGGHRRSSYWPLKAKTLLSVFGGRWIAWHRHIWIAWHRPVCPVLSIHGHVYKAGTSSSPPPAPHPPTPPRRLVCVQAKKYINLCSLLIYTPSSVRHRPRRNRSVFSCKMRLAFILIVNLYAADDPPPPTPGFFNENARCTNPPDSLCFLR